MSVAPFSSSTHQDPADLEQRSALARWLSDLFSGHGDPSAAPPPTDRLPPAVSGAATRLGAIPSASDLRDRVESERVRLFVNAPGGVPAPPYGSWWLDGTLAGSSTAAVEAIYADEGLRPGSGAGPADFLPTELEFVHFLLQHQIAARRTGATDLEHDARRRERRFLDDHVVRWIPPFLAAAREATADPTWIAAFDLLEHLLDDEVRRARSV
jgi:TorA maturation chaperone TorD